MTGGRDGRRHGDRDPEAELTTLRRRFAAVSRRLDRPARIRRWLRGALVGAVAIGGVCALVLVLMNDLRTDSPLVVLRHLAAFPNCEAARAVELAPARAGRPGYWARNDRDGDGVSCEPVRR